MRRSTNDASLIVSVNPNSPRSEVYRLLRTRIQFSSKDQDLKTLVITSAQTGEGKTTTISNLAVIYAQEGKKVLLIDANMRKPSLHKMFSQMNHQGLSTVITGKDSFENAVQDTYISNLRLLPAGPIPSNPSELIDSPAMWGLLEELEAQYDVILIDTPAMLEVSDSVIFSAMCDGVVMVAAAGRARKDYLRKAKEQLHHVNARILGVVLNQVG
ncbi:MULTISPECIES: CpsD/CapB family tyrosine-protein kinase [Paenibacillus]|uniref:non-specific protein-tyrosine kinase n=2 Tax=Paenibacillus TaxID=44249 RepID=G4HNF0_9BACL|nr:MULTISPECIES: CpsD/CapB family tyrosine-protein kinase [Paenibacillus]ANY73380.1 capsular biosynthesis protein [Paenibacillus ihbetae]EHB50681.1 capsular exopolysaccharide family [Paenibacillus lactis 154]